MTVNLLYGSCFGFALRFTLTHGKAGPGNHNNDLPTHLTMFDHAVLRPDGSIAGGNLKIHLLDHYSPNHLIICGPSGSG